MANYTWSYTFSSRPPDQDKAETLWIWEEASVYPLSDRDCLLRNRRTHAEVVVRLDVLNALQLCRRFRSLDAHAQAICQAIPAVAQQRADVRQVVDTLARQGILRSAQELLQTLQTPSNVDGVGPLKQVFIRTCDRPELLRRLLDSLVANQRRFGNHYHYLVIDDSLQEIHRDNNAAQVAALADNLDINYYGIIHQRRLLAQLLEVFPTHAESLRWLLLGSGQHRGKTYGRGWNHALLLGAGCRFLMIDDDALCQAYKPPQGGAGIEISTREEQAWFYQDRDMAGAAEPADIDPLARHAAAIGLPLSEVVKNCAQAPLTIQSLQHLTPELLTHLNATSPVLITGNAVFGDPGTGSNQWLFLNLEGESWQQFVRSETAYRRHCVERDLWKGYENLRVTPDKSCMATTVIGLDNRSLLPPTAPELAGEDGLFGAAVKFIYPSSLYLQFPWGLPHLPEPRRHWGQTAFERALKPPILNFMEDMAVSGRLRCLAQAPERRLSALAALYEDLAHADAKRLDEVIQEYGLFARTNLVKRLNRALHAFQKAPHYWQEDVQRIIQANSQVAANGVEADGAQSPAIARETLYRYATALHSWPAVWGYCRQHRSLLLENALA